MGAFEQDFKQAIEKLQEERKAQGKRPYNVHYYRLSRTSRVFGKVLIQGGSSGFSVEVYLNARGYEVITLQDNTKRTFKKNELDDVVNYIKDLLEAPLTN